MYKLCKIVITSLMLCILSITLLSADNNHAAAYIRMGAGARMLGMGSSAAGYVQDVNAGYWNPAGLTGMKGVEFSSMYSFNMGIDRTYNYMAIGNRFSFGYLALSWINANMTDIQGYDELGNPSGNFDNNENNIGLSYAYAYNRIKAGLTTKFYFSNIDDDSETGMGIDLGLQYDLHEYIMLGLMLRDIYGELADDDIPYQISFGIGVFPIAGMTVGADVRVEEERDPTFSFGAEYMLSIGKDPEGTTSLYHLIAPKRQSSWQYILSYTQLGFRVGMDDGNLSAGFGLGYKQFVLDYAFMSAPQNFLNDTHRLSITFKY